MFKFKTIIVNLLLGLLLFVSCRERVYTIEDFEREVKIDNISKVEKMLKTTDINQLVFFHNRNLLHVAIVEKAEKIMNKLIKEGVFLNSADDSGSTPLHMLIIQDNVEGVDLLLSQNVDIDVVDKLNEVTPIYYAINNNNVEITRKLLEKGADINQQRGLMKDTPLHMAIEQEKIEIVKLLDSLKALHTIKNINDDTAIDLVNETGNVEIISLFFDSYSSLAKNELLYNAIRNDTYPEKFVESKEDKISRLLRDF